MKEKFSTAKTNRGLIARVQFANLEIREIIYFISVNKI